MRGGKDGFFTAIATTGLTLGMLGWVTDGRLAWVLRLGGLALTATAAVGLAYTMMRQRSK